MLRFVSNLIVTLLFSLGGHAHFPYTPEGIQSGSLCSPQDPHFLKYRYEEQIPYCERNVRESLKSRIFAAYGVPLRCRHEYTIDHFIPLALGGSNRIDNLWPEHKRVKAVRYDLEVNLYLAMKNSQIRQREAVQAIIQAKLNPPIEKIKLKDICR